MELLAAVLTILRAYHVAGQPDQGLPAWGSYEGWSGLIRGAVVWIGLPDPAGTRITMLEQSDSVAEAMTVLLECWERMDETAKGLTAAQVIATLFKDKRAANSPAPPDWHGDMRAAIESLIGRGDSRALGIKLRQYRRRIFGGRYFDRAGQEHRAIRWHVYPASAFGSAATPDTTDAAESAVTDAELF
jgi:hypothetical protein